MLCNPSRGDSSQFQVDLCQHVAREGSPFSLMRNPGTIQFHPWALPGDSQWQVLAALPSSFTPTQHLGFSIISCTFFAPFLCLGTWRPTYMRAKPTAIRAKEDGNNPHGKSGASILSKTGPGFSLDNLGYSQKVPILT